MTTTAQLEDAARITVLYLILYTCAFVNVLKTKKQLLGKDKKFDRYTSPDMLNADRLVGNYMEWTPIFLGLVWSLAATDHLTSYPVTASYLYIGCRVLYAVLIIRVGVKRDGKNPGLWMSTVPAYFSLIYLFRQAIANLFF